ncbi:MAG: hypothetical protein ABI183_16495 [Polyangiaceae bacterium]
MRRVSLVVLLFCFAACDSTDNPVTPKGTVILDWNSTQATRKTFSTATIGAKTSKDFHVVVHPQATPPFLLDLHVELAPVDFLEGEKPVHQTSAVAIKITTGDNLGWQLAAKCEDGPNYQMGGVDDAGVMLSPLGMVQDCTVTEHRIAGTLFKSSWDIGSTFVIYGDGRVTASPEDEVTVTAK